MKFTTRLIITIATFIVLPMILAIAFYILWDLDVKIPKELVALLFFALLGVLMTSSIPLTFWVRHSFVRPFTELRAEMQKIAGGNFSDPVVSKEKGELGELFADFEKMRCELQLSEEEKKANEQKNRELIINISHDLKTPVTSIKGYVEGIMDGVADSPEKMEKYLKTISVKANDMDRLIDELTMYSRIDSNQIPLNMHVIGVGDYFGDCVEEVGFDLEQRNIELIYENNLSGNVKIEADPEQLKRVIGNIIGNSVKYRNENQSRIKISLKDEDKNVLIDIEDNGRGVEEEELQRIFDKFYRTDTSRNSREGGNGIGLAIAKKIVEDHRGTIWATGVSEGGLCIHISLPKYEDNNVSTEENGDLKSKNILGQFMTNTAKEIKTGAENAAKGIRPGRKKGISKDEQNSNN